ncbi:hypothetical protein [Paenibacillus odorifer]|uniref:hypothetical protein n=1 Tax=Paenibacillus odorifer TaxID=189426 RepID=UPI0021163149|nr:hypothetical protein [Paenibacillus odorifer]
MDYLKQNAPNYKGEANYIEKQAVSSEYIITANGTASLEFAREVMKKLEGFPIEAVEGWYKFFKDGFYQE